MNIATTKERLLQYIDYLGISKNKFFQETGLRRGFLDGDKLKSSIPDTFIATIVAQYPELNIEWLITGKGQMLQSLPCICDADRGVPYYDVDFAGGFIEIYNNQTITPDHNIVFHPFSRAQLWCNVTGNSMANLINHGDIIAIKELPNWHENVLYGEIYAIVTDCLRTIKIIRKSKKKGFIKLSPVNTAEFDEVEIKTTSVIRVFNVLGAIKKFF
ncbi:MAG: S24 family peptidase [Marinifilaceae bacterium]|jgi:hypothetical protein|nr:S24 family peptidase [Marinifilaceae bacterium]